MDLVINTLDFCKDFIYYIVISIYSICGGRVNMENKKKVLIIGGGYGGCTLAKDLDSKFDVTLIERKKMFVHNVATVRAVVEPSLVNKIFLSYENLLKNGKLVNGTVIEVSPTKVTLDDGQTYNFDYLVLATGTNSLGPWKAPLEIVGKDIKKYYSNISQQIKAAKKILVIGGGSVGVELIGEITHLYNGKSTESKEITLVHSSDKLVGPKMSDKFHTKVYDAMKSRNVNIVLNDKMKMPTQLVSSIKNQSLPNPPIQVSPLTTYTTDNGTNIEADLVIWTVGSKINNEVYSKHFSSSMNENGQLRVNQHCQVENYNNVFAVGDITDIPELKTSYNAVYHASVVSKVISSLAKGKTTNLSAHKPSETIMVLSLGPNDGISQLPFGMIVGGFLTKNIKSKAMFISNYFNLLNKPKEFSFE